MRTTSNDATALAAEIGPRGSTHVDSSNRGKVQNWLTAQGIPSKAVKAMRLSTLHSCYNSDKYLSRVLENPRNHASEPEPATSEPVIMGGRRCINFERCSFLTLNQDGVCDYCASQEPKRCKDCRLSLRTVNAQGYCHNCAGNHAETVRIDEPQQTPATQEPNNMPSPRFSLLDVSEIEPAPVKRRSPAVIEHAPQDDKTAQHEAARKLAEALAAVSALGKAPLDEGRVVALIKEHAPKPETNTLRIEITSNGATVRTLDPEPRHKLFPELLEYAAAGVHIALIGPAGSGKTHIGEQIARALGRAWHFTGAVASEFKLLGYKDATGTYHATEFRKAYENGGVFGFDEIDASIPAALLAVNAGLANGHMDFPDGPIARHPEFLCIGMANTWWNGADRSYVGRNQLDAATLDRFAFFDFEYDESLERQLTGNDAWVDRVQSVRRAVRDLKLRHIVSPRASIFGARVLARGVAQESVERTFLWKGLDADTVSKIKANARH